MIGMFLFDWFGSSDLPRICLLAAWACFNSEGSL